MTPSIRPGNREPDVICHDGMECDPDCDACEFAAEVMRLKDAIRHVIAYSPGTPEAVKEFLRRALASASPASAGRPNKSDER